VVSVGSTPTARYARDLTGVIEVRAGVFMFGDLFQAGYLGSNRLLFRPNPPPVSEQFAQRFRRFRHRCFGPIRHSCGLRAAVSDL